MQGVGCRGAGCRVQGAGCRVQGAGCRVQGVPLELEVGFVLLLEHRILPVDLPVPHVPVCGSKNKIRP